MSLFGSQRKTVVKEREVDSSVSDNAVRLEKLAEVDDDQVRADITIDNLALAFDKNDRIKVVSNEIAISNPEVFIPVHPSNIDTSVETYQVRSALLRNYQAESENATIIRWDLFKKIVDNAINKQESVVQYLSDLGTFNQQLDEINIGNLYSLLNRDIKIDQFKQREELGQEQKDAQKDLWKQVGVAFLSFFLMDQFHKIAPMFTGKKDIKDAQDEPISADAQEAAKQQSAKISKIQVAITRIAEAVVLFALIHSLTKKQTIVLARTVQPDTISPELQTEYIDRVSQVYDSPPEEISELILAENTDDEIIFEYCMAYIKANKESKNFTPWITYAISRIRETQMQDLAVSLDGTSDEANKLQSIIEKENIDTAYRAPGPSIERDMMRYDASIGKLNVRDSDPYLSPNRLTRDSDSARFEIHTLLDNDSPMSKYTPGRNQKLGFDLSNYMHDINNYTGRSGATSDYFMGLMQNNKYTPELVCCLLKFLADDLDFLKNLRKVLDLFGKGVKFDWGSLLEDITHSLFGDLRSKILTYALMEITKFMAKLKKPILEWIDRLETEEEFIAFCTPIIDMAKILLQIISEFERLLKNLASEIINSLLAFELKVDNGIIEMHGTSRYLNIIAILDAIIFALENGQLCNQKDLAPTDIHPDALPIISRLSRRPSAPVQESVAKTRAFNEAVERDGAVTSDTKLVHPFKDPEDTDLRLPISVDRTYNGESTIEAITRYSKNCGAYKHKAADLLKGLI